MRCAFISGLGFPAELPLGEPSFDGNSKRRTTYAVDVTAENGLRLMLNLTLSNAKQGGRGSGGMSVIRADGATRTFNLESEQLLFQGRAKQQRGR